MIRAVIDKWASIPFEYGADCCQFVGECVEAQTGNNPMAAFKYASQDEAYEIINGYGGLTNAITATMGDPVKEIREGYVCVADSPLGEIAGVVYRGHMIVRTEHSITDWPITRAKHFWKP